MERNLDAFEQRTRAFAISAIRLGGDLEGLPGVRWVGGQLARSAGSVAANHRAMRRARSTREFAAKLQIVNEEIDEVVMWLEIVRSVRPELDESTSRLRAESRELRAMFAKARATTKRRLQREKENGAEGQ